MDGLLNEILLNFRFGVVFMVGGLVPNPLDIRFQKVRGLSVEVKTSPIESGGNNLYTQQLPTKVDHGNLTLERGMIVGSPLNIEFKAAMSLFTFVPSTIFVFLFNENSIPVAAWMFIKAYPVKWSVSDLNASDKGLMIDTLELAYARMQILRI